MTAGPEKANRLSERLGPQAWSDTTANTSSFLLDALLDSEIAVLVIDASCKLRDANASAKELLKLREDSIGTPFLEICRLVDESNRELDHGLNEITEAIRKQVSFTIPEVAFINPDRDSKRWLRLSGKPMSLRQGNARTKTGMLITAFDVTDYVVSSQITLAAKERSRFAERSARIASWSYDVESKAVNWSKEALRMYDLAVDSSDPTFENLLSVLSRSDAEDMRHAITETLNGTASQELRQVVSHRDGTEVYVRTLLQPVTNARGVVHRVMGVMMDITATEQANRFSQLLAHVAERTENAVMITDDHGRIQWANSSFTRITGYTLQDVLGKDPLGFLPGELTDPDATEALKQAVRSGSAVSQEILNYTKAGRPIWLRTDIQPVFTAENRVQQFVSIQVDLTRQKEALDRLAELTRSLQIKIERKDRFFSIISHDLRAPYTSILGLSSILQGDFESLDATSIKKLSERIHNAARRNLEYLEQLLLWASAQSGRLTVTRRQVAVAELLEAATRTVAEFAASKPVELEIECDSELEAHLDEHMMRSVVHNLVLNGIKFSHPNQTVTIRAFANSPDLTLQVQDRGVGISRDRQAELFNHGERRHTRGTAGESGSGLGLILCKDLVELHDGTLDLDSVPEQGTTITVVLPNAQNLARRKTRVLLADSNLQALQELESSVAELPIWLSKASSGAEALDLARTGGFRLALVRAELVDMSGFELAQKLKHCCSGLLIFGLSEPNESETRGTWEEHGVELLPSHVSAAKMQEIIDSLEKEPVEDR
ncbi:MAG: PAS domain-containing protein [Myxococcota bacterium]